MRFEEEMNSNKIKSVKLNMIMNAILTMSSFLFPLITFPYISRIILPIGTGKITFATSIVTYFSMFAQLGIPTYGVKACAKVRDDKEELSRVAQEILIINLITCLFAYLALFASIFYVPKLNEEKELIFIISSTILLTALGVEWLYKALEEYTYITIRSIGFKFIALISMFVLIHKRTDYILYGAITIFAATASNILNFINVRKLIYIHPVGKYNFKRHFKSIIIYFAMAVATTIYTNLDNVMLGFINGDEEVGYYSAAVKIKNLVISVVTSASTVLLPRASYYVEKGMMEEFKSVTKKTMNCILLMSIPAAVYFMLFAKEGIYLLSGEAFAGAIIPMQIIMPTIVFIGITNVLGIQIMIPLGQEIQVLYSEIAGAVIDLVLNIILIPLLGAAGAAIGTLAAEIVVFVWQSMVLKEFAREMFDNVRWRLIIFTMIIAVCATGWVKILAVSSFVTLAISFSIFTLVTIVLLVVRKEELVLEILFQVYSKVRKNKEK